jgi:hypothetical protein
LLFAGVVGRLRLNLGAAAEAAAEAAGAADKVSVLREDQPDFALFNST